MTLYEIFDITVTPIVTILAGLVVLYIYYKQKRDERASVASIVLLEIQQAENAIDAIKPDNKVDDIVSVLPNNTWSKAHHLFIKDLTHEERVLLTNFYTECEVIESAIREYRDYLSISRTEKVKATQVLLSQIHYDAVANEKVVDADKVLEQYFENDSWFKPHNAQQVIDTYMNRFRHITNTPLETKLRSISLQRNK